MHNISLASPRRICCGGSGVGGPTLVRFFLYFKLLRDFLASVLRVKIKPPDLRKVEKESGMITSFLVPTKWNRHSCSLDTAIKTEALNGYFFSLNCTVCSGGNGVHFRSK